MAMDYGELAGRLEAAWERRELIQPLSRSAGMTTRCPELETGRNSVRPWTTPRITACRMVKGSPSLRRGPCEGYNLRKVPCEAKRSNSPARIAARISFASRTSV